MRSVILFAKARSVLVDAINVHLKLT